MGWLWLVLLPCRWGCILCPRRSVLLVGIRVSLINRLLVWTRIHDCLVVDSLMQIGLFRFRSVTVRVCLLGVGYKEGAMYFGEEVALHDCLEVRQRHYGMTGNRRKHACSRDSRKAGTSGPVPSLFTWSPRPLLQRMGKKIWNENKATIIMLVYRIGIGVGVGAD